ncbi:hypothetical protein F5Y12DRAFT_718775 [Xylaria sp. FL1777]|nr:hypothetical protein F5Y12DRAFT_718775 [Xylaria sp. FL1777]
MQCKQRRQQEGPNQLASDNVLRQQRVCDKPMQPRGAYDDGDGDGDGDSDVDDNDVYDNEVEEEEEEDEDPDANDDNDDDDDDSVAGFVVSGWGFSNVAAVVVADEGIQSSQRRSIEQSLIDSRHGQECNEKPRHRYAKNME